MESLYRLYLIASYLNKVYLDDLPPICRPPGDPSSFSAACLAPPLRSSFYISEPPNEIPALAPLGERVARRGVFISRGETGEGVQAQRAIGILSFHEFDPLTRPAPAGEGAGCGPPSPPKGRGLSRAHSTVPFLHRAFHRKCTNSRAGLYRLRKNSSARVTTPALGAPPLLNQEGSCLKCSPPQVRRGGAPSAGVVVRVFPQPLLAPPFPSSSKVSLGGEKSGLASNEELFNELPTQDTRL